jgi:hypothetical protein
MYNMVQTGTEYIENKESYPLVACKEDWFTSELM